MNKKTIFTLIAGLTALFSFSSCEDIIDVDLNSVDPELVIEGTVRMGAAAEVLITKTKDFGDSNDYPPITDAVVTISDDAGNTETLQCNAEGRYVATTIVGTERTTYYLSVKYEDVEYTATSYMPPRVEIESLTVWKMPIMDYAVPQVHFMDPVGKENEYYRYVLYINHEKPLLKDRLEDRLMSTEFSDGVKISHPIFIRYVNGGRDDDPIEQGDVVTVEMQCIDRGVYKYFDTLYNIDEGLANPTSNIKGGALGYFGAYSYTSADLEMRWED
ncbi:DUF4249 domain-containing protein [Bacteroides sp. 51]|uniref:DUF4249 domain-containing protein n=1 Tax=Bacteroides sp. 51 TaxID=2302938 RepID=UPI0013D51B10|nr:DUF4249 domain-containing protein [Bacteroides sp. 51]NDV82412.1 DUF4249 domain-containing protein [Bacteroides sp. 51]